MAPTPDLSAFDAIARQRKSGATLRVDEVLAELDADQSAALNAALADLRYSARVVAEVVTNWGPSLSAAAVRTWRTRHGIE